MPRSPAQKRKTSARPRAKSATKKQTRKAQKRMQKVRKAVSLATIFLLSGIFLGGFTTYKKLNKELASAFSASTYDILSEDIYSVAFIVAEDFSENPVKTNEIYLYIFDKSTSKVLKYEIPVDTQIDVPGRYGVEPFKNILPLGNLKDDAMVESLDLMSRSLYKLLAFPIDRYVVVEKNVAEFASGMFEGNLSFDDDLTIASLKDSIKTNLSIQEIYKTHLFSKSLPQDRIIQKKYVDTYVDNPLLLDEELMDITFDTEFSNEKKSIAVLNGSDFPGMAGFGSRVVKNMGGRVVAVGNTEKTYEHSVIIVDDSISQSVRLLKNVFEIDEVILDSAARNYDEAEIDRSDITIIIGLDFGKSM